MALEPSIFLKDLITNHVLSHSGRYGYCSAPRTTSHGEFRRKYRRRYVRLDTTHYFTHVSPSSLYWIDLVAWLQIPYNCCDRTGWWLRLFINMIQAVTQVVSLPPFEDFGVLWLVARYINRGQGSRASLVVLSSAMRRFIASTRCSCCTS